MRVAMSMRSLHKSLVKKDMSVIDFLKYAASLAVDGVELDDIYFKCVDVDYIKIQETLQDTGLKVSCYDIHHPMQLLHQDRRQEALDKLKKELAVAELLGAENVQIVGEVFDSSVSASNVQTLISQLVDLVLPLLEGTELTLSIENPASAEFQSQHMAQLLKEIDNPRVKVGFNMANSLITGEDPERALEQLKEQIAYVRAVDVRLALQDEEPQSGIYVGCVVGLGLVPLETLFQVLQAQSYTGWIALEFTGLEEAHFGTEASLKNLRRALTELQIEAFHPRNL